MNSQIQISCAWCWSVVEVEVDAVAVALQVDEVLELLAKTMEPQVAADTGQSHRTRTPQDVIDRPALGQTLWSHETSGSKTFGKGASQSHTRAGV